MIHTIALYVAAVLGGADIFWNVSQMFSGQTIVYRVGSFILSALYAFSLYGVLSALGWVS